MTGRPRGHTLGVAVEIASPARELLEEARERYEPTFGEMPPHVTVLPPIDVDDDALPAVMRHLAAAAAATPPFRLTLRGTGTFRPVSPVVFVAVVEGAEECGALEARVRSGDMAVETRFPYHPHVTVALEVAPEVLDRAEADLADFSASMEVRSLGLYERRDGRWVLVREFPLGGAAPAAQDPETRRLLLHVGRSKTGTTAFQHFVAARARELGAAGLRVPDFLRGPNNLELAVAYSRRPGSIAEPLGAQTPESRAELRRDLGERLARHVRPGQTWLITSENIGMRLRSRAEVEALLTDLRRHFDEIVVVAHIRRPDHLVASLYGESVKSGSAEPLDGSLLESHPRAFFQAGFRDMWTTPHARLLLRPYVERYRRERTALLDDWTAIVADAVGIDIGPVVAAGVPEGPANAGLSAVATEYLRQVNGTPEGAALSRTARTRLLDALREVPGPGIMPTASVLAALDERGWRDGGLDRHDPGLAGDPAWQEWFDQPPPATAPPASVPDSERAALDAALRSASPAGEGRAGRLARALTGSLKRPRP